MTPGLISRLQDIPGVESVSVDLTGDSGSVNLRVEPDADENKILTQVQALLVSYGINGLRQPDVTVGRFTGDLSSLGLDIRIHPYEDGARIQVTSGSIQSARQVPSTPKGITQGLVDAWCQVSGKAPREVTSVILGDTGALAVVVSDGTNSRRGVADISAGWANALTYAVGSALGFLGDNGADRSKLAPTAW